MLFNVITLPGYFKGCCDGLYLACSTNMNTTLEKYVKDKIIACVKKL